MAVLVHNLFRGNKAKLNAKLCEALVWSILACGILSLVTLISAAGLVAQVAGTGTLSTVSITGLQAIKTDSSGLEMGCNSRPGRLDGARLGCCPNLPHSQRSQEEWPEIRCLLSLSLPTSVSSPSYSSASLSDT